MFGKLRQLVSGRRNVTALTPSAAEEPPALVIARRERVVGADWAGAKSWFGGAPKLGDTPWPRDKKGTPLYFLAQLDLSEIDAAGHGRTADVLAVRRQRRVPILDAGQTRSGRVMSRKQR